ncbi:hypothetical protein CLV51_10459 [Chitinophaga niastensis]|uniref:Uncharacterized protein n=1 Tax=Chitinophaga niastensis TaxID=536980 RepID=A0A2P8HGK3_CHINA|nr:hypothetical protein [Chitinophaga niastensis]PSL45357.1 hypothetical protein CLV51_10459 [Chitinophaga niastensis]
MSIEPVLIERHKVGPPAMDYDGLLKEAIARIQELSGTIWTDYNQHDPGVTILQQLCYAITDPAYRTAFLIEDILADKNNNIDPLQHTFYRKANMLTSAPVTVNDYRKLVLDEIEDIENIWIEPVQTWQPSGCTKGMYRVFIQVEDNIAENMTANADVVQKLAAQVDHCLQSYRNIGEDFEPVVVLQPQEIYIKAEIFVDSRHDPQQILAMTCNAFEMTLHPPVRFVSAAEMYINGYTPEDLYAGPLLKKGFVANSDLRERKESVDPADLMKAVSAVEGVLKVKAIYLAGEDGNYIAKPVTIKAGCYPFLQMVNDKHEIKISSDKAEYNLRDASFLNMYQQVRVVARRKFAGHKNSEASKPLKGIYRDIGKYYSLQHHFPAIYGIGRDGLEKETPGLRKAQAKQLKAYLLFFEQLLANYLAQLNSMGTFFSPYLDQTPPFTYATQPLYAVPHVAPLLKAFTDKDPQSSWDHFTADTGNGYMKKLQEFVESDKLYQERKNHVLDHLLARFNLVLTKYPVAFYEQVYGNDPKKRINLELEWKADVLRQIPTLSSNRNRSFNYRDDIFSTDELSGYENILHKLLHIRIAKRKRLTAAFDSGNWNVAVSHPGQPHVHVHLVKEYKLKDEILKVNVAESNEGEIITGKKYDYGRQSVSLLRYGLDTKNYRIVYDRDDNVYLVIYRHSAHALWQIVIRENTPEEATRSLNEMIHHLKQVSIDSEGCYLLEHLLLKPGFQEAGFGYRIYNRENSLLLQHANWSKLDEREAQLQQLQTLAADMDATAAAANWQQLQAVYKLYFYRNNAPEVLTAAHFTDPATKDDAGKTMENILLQIRQMKPNQQRYARVEHYVKYGASQMLHEDFFKFGMSIIFPAWPARFQYKEFRSFTEELFKEHTPVQFHLHFKWLGIAAMHDFESRYFAWLKAMHEKVQDRLATTAIIDVMVKDPAFAQYVFPE